MHLELVSSKLEYKLAPHPDPEKHKDGCRRRQVETRNPEWYRKLLRVYPSERKKRRRYSNPKKVGCDSKVKRRNIESILLRLSEGKSSRSKYADDLEEIARKRLKEWNCLKTEVEKFFWFRYNLTLEEELIDFLSHLNEEDWEEIGRFYESNGCFPEYVYNKPPF
ncbi:hypothetical protein ACFL08_04855 [Patescibacteria group bacterium]